MGFIKLENLISPALKRAGIKKQADVALAIERAEFCIKEFLGEDAAVELKPIAIRYRALLVASLHHGAAAALGASERDVLEYINGGLQKPLIDRIQIVTS